MRKFIVIGESKLVVVQVLLAIHAFADARCFVICASGTRFLRRSILSSEYMETGFDGENDDALAERINRFSGTPADAVLIAADCAGARLIDRIRQRLSVSIAPSPSTPMLDCFDDKWRFYQFCMEQGLNVPLTHFVGSKRELDYAATAMALGLPFIVKPVNENSSRGMYVISSEEEYRRHILDNPSYEYAPLIAQRHIEGMDVGLNLLSVRGKIKAIAIQQRIDPCHDGSRIKFFSNPYLENTARIVAEAGNYDGAMNIDARIEKGSGKVYLFESNPRFWRSLSASVWCGLNFVAQSALPSCEGEMRKLTSGSADTYYHPLFRPSLWPYVLFDRGHRGKMARAMIFDICTLLTSVRILSARIGRAALSFSRMAPSRVRKTPGLSAPVGGSTHMP